MKEPTLIEEQGTSKTSYLLLIFLAVFVALLSYFTPYQRDDFLYAFIWHTNQRLQTFRDIIPSIHNHYMLWGGRIVPVFIMQAFHLLGKGYFAVVNGIMYSLLMVLIYWHGAKGVSKNFNPWLLATIIVSSWFALPDYAFTNIWACGTANYLWPLVLILASLLPYHIGFIRHSCKESFTLSSAFSILLFPLALIASITIENSVLIMFLTITAALIYAYREKCLKGWMFSGWLGSFLGTFILFIAPGNFARAASVHTHWYNNIGNFIGAHVQILLGLLPVLLLIRLLLKLWFNGESTVGNSKNIRLTKGFYFKLVLVVVLVASNYVGHFFSHWLTGAIIGYIINPLGLGNETLYERLSYALSSSEAVLIFILTSCVLSQLAQQYFNLKTISVKQLFRKLPKLAFYAENKSLCQRLLILLVMALLHNGAMLFTPQFPARAGYGSVVFLLIAMTILLRAKKNFYLLFNRQKVVWFCILFLGIVPMAAETLNVSYTIYTENTAREKYIAEQVAAGATQLTLKPISEGTSVLRHVYFGDLDGNFALGCAKPYYQLQKITLTKKP